MSSFANFKSQDCSGRTLPVKVQDPILSLPSNEAVIHADRLSTLFSDHGHDEVWTCSDPQQQTVLSVLEPGPVPLEYQVSSQEAHRVANTERADNVLGT